MENPEWNPKVTRFKRICDSANIRNNFVRSRILCIRNRELLSRAYRRINEILSVILTEWKPWFTFG